MWRTYSGVHAVAADTQALCEHPDPSAAAFSFLHFTNLLALLCVMLLWFLHRRYFPELVLAVLLQAFAATGLFLLTAWLPSYFMQLTGMVPATALLIHTINMAALAGSMPLGGLLADEWESTSVLLGTCVTATAFAYPAWLLFSLGVAEVTWFAQFCLCVLVGLHWGALTQPLADLFPLQMRSSALTVAHVVPMLALGSTAPLMAIRFIGDTGNLAAPAYINIIMAALTAAVVTWQSLKGRGGVLHH